jgi:hypothetical protein
MIASENELKVCERWKCGLDPMRERTAAGGRLVDDWTKRALGEGKLAGRSRSGL